MLIQHNTITKNYFSSQHLCASKVKHVICIIVFCVVPIVILVNIFKQVQWFQFSIGFQGSAIFTRACPKGENFFKKNMKMLTWTTTKTLIQCLMFAKLYNCYSNFYYTTTTT
jgi:hypothetical protein